MGMVAITTETLTPRIVVSVTNAGASTFTGHYLGQEYQIESGKTLKSVPWPAVCLWFGDPEVQDTPRWKSRHEMYERLKIRYGAYEDVDLWAKNRPHCKVKDLDGNEIVMIVDDPQGSEPTSPRAADEKALLMEMLDRQQREMAAMKDRLA